MGRKVYPMNKDRRQASEHVVKPREQLSRFLDARNKGVAFLLMQQADDGAFPAQEPSLTDYYKALTAFQVCGHNAAANRLCDWIRRYGLTSDGDFGPRPVAGRGYAYTYFNAWVVCGAQRLGEFDLARRGMTFLLNFRDEESGGFYASAKDRQPDTEQDLMVTCMNGLAALYAGHIEVARGVGGWLKTVMEAQPDFPATLYTTYSRAHGLYTNPPAETAIRYVVSSAAEEDQYFFQPGIACAFLCRLYQATGDDQWLDLAQKYMQFAEVASDYLFRIVRAGKVGWAAALLTTLNGNDKYREMAIRIGNNLIDLQAEEGYWSGVGSTEPCNDSTAERTVWMDEIYQAVSQKT